MKEFLLTALLLASFSASAQLGYQSQLGTQSSAPQSTAPLPVLSVPYIPVTPARPVDTKAAIANADANRQALQAFAEEERREAIAACAVKTQKLYDSFNASSTVIADGWYKIAATDGAIMCGERKVFVLGNRITRWVVESSRLEPQVEASSLIEEGFATVKVGGVYVRCYFLDNILNPSLRAADPTQ